MSSLTPRPLAPIAITHTSSPPITETPPPPVEPLASVGTLISNSLPHNSPPSTYTTITKLNNTDSNVPAPIAPISRRDSAPLMVNASTRLPSESLVAHNEAVDPGLGQRVVGIQGSTSRPITFGIGGANGGGVFRRGRGPLAGFGGGFDAAPTPGNTPSSLERIGRRIASNLLISDALPEAINRIAPSYERKFTVGLKDLERRLTEESHEQRLPTLPIDPIRPGSPLSAASSTTAHEDVSGLGDREVFAISQNKEKDWPTSFSVSSIDKDEKAEVLETQGQKTK